MYVCMFICIYLFVYLCFQCRSRLNLSLGTVFYAANYLDRFISMNHCNVRNITRCIIFFNFSNFPISFFIIIFFGDKKLNANVHYLCIFRDGNIGWWNCCLLPVYPLPPNSTIPALRRCSKFR